MRIEILDQAAEDLIEGFHFYEAQQSGLGAYFLSNLYGDIESLRLYGGIHRQAYKEYRRLLSKRFPFAVFYTVQRETIVTVQILGAKNTWSYGVTQG